MISAIVVIIIAVCALIVKGGEIGRKNAIRNRKKLRNL